MSELPEPAVSVSPQPATRADDIPFNPRIVWAVLFLALMLFQGYVVFVQPHGLSATTGHEERPVGEVAGLVSVRQTFTVKAGGLDAITVYPRRSGQEHPGPVIFELSEAGDDATGDADAPIFRTVVETRRVVDDKSFTWRFTPIEDSSGKRYALRVSMPAAPFDHGVTLLATRHEEYRDGQLWFDQREQWGDLVFQTSASRATAFQRFEHALRDKPKWLRSRVTLGFFFLFYNIALGIVMWAFLTMPADEAVDGAGARDEGGELAKASPRARAAGLVALIGICAFAAYEMYQPRVSIERGARELINEFPDTVKRTQMKSLQDGFSRPSIVWNGRRMECLMALPHSRILWTVNVQPDTELVGWFGLRQEAWSGGLSDGAMFRVGVTDQGRYLEQVKRYLHPDIEERDRTFVPIKVDLSPYVGRQIEIVLNTEPGSAGNANGDAASWCEVRIVGKK